jgi:hypothetical protein
MDYNKYHNTLRLVDRFPSKSRKFVVFEYTYSPSGSAIHQAEYVPGTTAYIHNVIQHPDFRANMVNLFGNANYYTRRKTDFSKPIGEQLTNIRQLVVVVEDEMPPLIHLNETVLNPEEHDDNWYSNQTVYNDYQHNP